ncbi:hypothetical protein [Paraburkholderia sp.]|nr:hypothetical protein [Paraburkholderia sp.]
MRKTVEAAIDALGSKGAWAIAAPPMRRSRDIEAKDANDATGQAA